MKCIVERIREKHSIKVDMYGKSQEDKTDDRKVRHDVKAEKEQQNITKLHLWLSRIGKNI